MTRKRTGVRRLGGREGGCSKVQPLHPSAEVEKRFDILVLTLTLLINLVEHCEHNRTVLLKSPIPLTNDDLFAPGSTASENRKTAGQALVQMFLENEENAKREESKTGNFSNMVFESFSLKNNKTENEAKFVL